MLTTREASDIDEARNMRAVLIRRHNGPGFHAEGTELVQHADGWTFRLKHATDMWDDVTIPSRILHWHATRYGLPFRAGSSRMIAEAHALAMPGADELVRPCWTATPCPLPDFRARCGQWTPEGIGGPCRQDAGHDGPHDDEIA